MKRIPFVLVLFALTLGLFGLTHCQNEVRCSEITCNAGEFCIFYGSDVASEPGKARCHKLPENCDKNAAQCDCLKGQTSRNGVNLDFCIDNGSCQETNNTIHLVCPGG